jgi:hypothetical protein
MSTCIQHSEISVWSQLEINGLHWVLIHVEDINSWAENIKTIKNDAKIILQANNRIGLGVHIDITKHLSISLNKNLQSKYKHAKSSFEYF